LLKLESQKLLEKYHESSKELERKNKELKKKKTSSKKSKKIDLLRKTSNA
jgi:hypothetical protein